MNGPKTTAAIYCRLSREDEEKQTESESIQNQRALLLKYAVEQGWDVYGIYCDEDRSGMDRQRPGFNLMLRDAQAGCFNLVLVKTQSRFTRDMELVERYIHGLFVEWGIRFVALVDHIDTAVKGNKKARQISGLVNEWYLEDLSENLRSVLDYKRRAGQYIGSFALYGYAKAPNDHNALVEDPEAAAVVRSIFERFLAGHGAGAIAAWLNGQGIPNPTCYRMQAGQGGKPCSPLWSRATVSRILRNQMYAGDMVQGRVKKLSYKTKRLVPVPQSDWILVEDTHPPLITKNTFTKAQALLEAKARQSSEQNWLQGRVFCALCGSRLQKTSSGGAKPHVYLRCPRHNRAQACPLTPLSLAWLEKALEQAAAHSGVQQLPLSACVKQVRAGPRPAPGEAHCLQIEWF